MTKAEKQKLKQEWREKEKLAFSASLPIPQELFKQLFDYVDEQLQKKGCGHTLDITMGFLQNNNISPDVVLQWLNEYGGYCDCEVIMNVEEHF